jgi:ribosome maturation factor RimP
MIDVKIISDLVEEKIQDTDLFLVDIKVDAKNSISIYIDSPEGVSIDQVVGVSRHVEHSLDREAEDFALEVSSPGIGYPFKVLGQYQKAINRTIEVLFLGGEKLQGKLLQVTNSNFTFGYTVKEKPEGAKRPLWVDKEKIIDFTEVKSVKEIIIF